MAGLKARHKDSPLHRLQSAEILAILEQNPAFRMAHTVVLYHSLPDEVYTHDFCNRWCREKDLLLPVVVGDDLELRRYRSEEDLAMGAFGILEPTGIPFTQPADIDLIVVPGVAFDSRGNRLGRGRGYYDRLLPRLTKARKIGICFPFQLVEHVPTEPLDICMDEIITIKKQ